MQSLWRLAPFFLAQRAALVASLVVALASSGLWAASLFMAFPIVKVLLQGESITEYVRRELATTEAQSQRLTVRLGWLNEQIAAHPPTTPAGSDASDAELQRLQRDRLRTQEQLSIAGRQQGWYRWTDRWVLPLVPADRFQSLALILALLSLITLLKGLGTFLQELLMGQIVHSILLRLRERMYRTTLKLDGQTCSLLGTPQLMSRFTNDLTHLGDGLNLVGGKVVVEPFKALACIVSAMAINWQLTTLSLVCVPFAALMFQAFGKRLKRAGRRQMESMARLCQVLEETLLSFRVVQAFRGERYHRRRFQQETRQYLHKALRIVQIDALTNPVTELFGLGAMLLALLPGAYLVLREERAIWGMNLTTTPLDVAKLAMLYTMLAGVLDPARKLSSVYSKLRKANAASDRLFELLDTPTLVPDAPEARSLPRHQTSIEFERVVFRYATSIAPAGKSAAESLARPPALDELSLRIPFGETVAVVGENGSGKSTLVQLVARLADPQSGTVAIDGVDLRRVSLRSLRAQLAVVTQETHLFEGTIADNIRYGLSLGQTDADGTAVERAAQMAHVVEFARQLPDGLQTQVGERGSRLSGGQRQRVALARALVRDPAILILDEATSAIDAHSELLIQRSLKAIAQDRTTLIVTHQLTPALLDVVTRVVFLDRGRVVGFGTHEQLLRTTPGYQRLFAAQQSKRAA